MMDFAESTGLFPEGKNPRRYLWTDAFAVCNFLELFRRTGDAHYRDLALRLVEQVHVVLGRHRPDDPRKGWISGLGAREGERHPTIGGLRIGKAMNERGPGEPFDEQLEWERDGQYFHYLTKWMHALGRVARITGEPVYNVWAMELAKTAHARFVRAPSLGGRKGMAWKMSIDLSRPLVPSMGQHDPLDGLVTFRQLKQAAERDFKGAGPDLSAEIAEMVGICRGGSWVTDDPLGIGGLLFDACRTVQWMLREGSDESGLLENILESSLPGLESGAVGRSLSLPAAYRLAFRELGLSIGMKAVEKMSGWIGNHPKVFGDASKSLTAILREHAGIGARIDKFWMERSNREGESWTGHRDINTVMLATSLAPEGFLGT
jgi:hypothetical protein